MGAIIEASPGARFSRRQLLGLDRNETPQETPNKIQNPIPNVDTENTLIKTALDKEVSRRVILEAIARIGRATPGFGIMALSKTAQEFGIINSNINQRIFEIGFGVVMGAGYGAKSTLGLGISGIGGIGGSFTYNNLSNIMESLGNGVRYVKTRLTGDRSLSEAQYGTAKPEQPIKLEENKPVKTEGK